ncbi:MAG: alpha/beta fold hydrolase [Colwellia sp.]|nr:alpha/beta fold hydrolase [Colwellia sp.]
MLSRTVLLLITAMLFVPMSLYAEPAAENNCLTVDNSEIVKSIEGGKYRFSNKVDEQELVTFDYAENQPFEQYLAYARQLIEQKNPRAQQYCPIDNDVFRLLSKQNSWKRLAQVSDFIAPFELKQINNDKAILLIHGLTDSPYVFHDLAAFYYQQGFTVRTLLLPGHATAPADLIDVELSQWRQATDYAITRTLGDFDNVYLGGFSTGGALILDYLITNEDANKEPNDKIKGLFLWSPASKAKSDIAWLAQYVDLIPFLDWVGKDADSDFAKYESFPFNAGAQVHDLMNDVYADNVDLPIKIKNIPMFVVVSEHDQTISTDATLGLISQWHNSSQQMNSGSDTVIYYGNADKSKQQLPKNLNLIVPICNEAELCAKVYDVAHTSVTNAPTNRHYGVDGQYRNCSHYVSDMVIYQQCKMSEQVIVGEKTAQNLQLGKPLYRLTYNPYYQQMLNEIKTFLKKSDAAQSE